MKVGKIILGFDGLKHIIDSAADKNACASLIVGLSTEAANNRQAELGVKCGFSFRVRYVEGITFEELQPMDGWLLDMKVGPDPVVEDQSQYKVVSFFAQQSATFKLVKIFRIDNPPQLGEE